MGNGWGAHCHWSIVAFERFRDVDPIFTETAVLLLLLLVTMLRYPWEVGGLRWIRPNQSLLV